MGSSHNSAVSTDEMGSHWTGIDLALISVKSELSDSDETASTATKVTTDWECSLEGEFVCIRHSKVSIHIAINPG